jgi:hypothetical protein
MLEVHQRVQCNEITFEATVCWRSHVATARDVSSLAAKNKALEFAISKGQARGERFNPIIREWYVVKLARFGRGTTLNCTFTPQHA